MRVLLSIIFVIASATYGSPDELTSRLTPPQAESFATNLPIGGRTAVISAIDEENMLATDRNYTTTWAGATKTPPVPAAPSSNIRAEEPVPPASDASQSQASKILPDDVFDLLFRNEKIRPEPEAFAEIPIETHLDPVNADIPSPDVGFQPASPEVPETDSSASSIEAHSKAQDDNSANQDDFVPSTASPAVFQLPKLIVRKTTQSSVTVPTVTDETIGCPDGSYPELNCSGRCKIIEEVCRRAEDTVGCYVCTDVPPFEQEQLLDKYNGGKETVTTKTVTTQTVTKKTVTGVLKWNEDGSDASQEDQPSTSTPYRSHEFDDGDYAIDDSLSTTTAWSWPRDLYPSADYYWTTRKPDTDTYDNYFKNKNNYRWSYASADNDDDKRSSYELPSAAIVIPIAVTVILTATFILLLLLYVRQKRRLRRRRSRRVNPHDIRRLFQDAIRAPGGGYHHLDEEDPRNGQVPIYHVPPPPEYAAYLEYSTLPPRYEQAQTHPRPPTPSSNRGPPELPGEGPPTNTSTAAQAPTTLSAADLSRAPSVADLGIPESPFDCPPPPPYCETGATSTTGATQAGIDGMEMCEMLRASAAVPGEAATNDSSEASRPADEDARLPAYSVAPIDATASEAV